MHFGMTVGTISLLHFDFTIQSDHAFYSENPPFVFASKYDVAGVSAKNVSVQELRYCFELFPKTPRSGGNRCESGEVSYTYLPEQNRYPGFYRFKFTDGTVLQGDFLAEYCPKSDPRP